MSSTMLLPPTIILQATSSRQGSGGGQGHRDGSPLPKIHANLMPFHLDYDGPAPVDSFMVIRRDQDSEPGDDGPANDDNPAPPSLISSFRGRSIHSTSLPLPEGFKCRLFSSSAESRAESFQTSDESSPTSTSLGGAGPSVGAKVGSRDGSSSEARDTRQDSSWEAQKVGLRRSPRKKTLPPPSRPVKAARFSMDTDSEEEGSEGDEGNGAGQEGEDEVLKTYHSLRPATPERFECDPEIASVGRIDRGEGEDVQAKGQEEEDDGQPHQSLVPVAQVADDHIRVWGPDGPIDRGDDVYFRTVEEWINVVGQEIHTF
ncbi:hypothetical protein IE53DRAFT_367367 [Violaceomyces palustris]|uniref:Uncharacterized protein n=1 Tax=Violaceomyces palustris TaxID=1673888 RepID=A0ACD0P280_9BASI|nr:hypothetical protein IE53DRAFT_367367 [Violaceomyces palustris]